MTSLQTLIQQIKKIQPIVSEDTDSGPVDTLSARRGRKVQAIEEMKRLKREYRLSLLNSAAFILVTGSEKGEFTKIATEEFSCFTTDPEEFYKDLVRRIPPVTYLGKEGIHNIFDIIGRHLFDKMIDLDIAEYNQLLFKQEYDKKIEKESDLVEIVKRAINKQIGAEIVGVQAISSLVDPALEKNFQDKIMPILLPVEDDQLATEILNDLDRLTSRIFVVGTGKVNKNMKSIQDILLTKEVNSNTVKQTLVTISKNIKVR